MRENKVAFVTGAGGYLGSGIACTLAKSGIKVAVSDVNEETLQQTVCKITQLGGTAKAYPADTANSAEVDRVIDSAFADLGGLDILVYAAGGGARPDSKPLVEQTDEVILRILNSNLVGSIFCARAAAKRMIEQGAGGRIITLSSIIGLNGAKMSTEYAAAKGGINGMTKALAKELGEYKITVNSVAPGVVARPGTDPKPEYVYGTNLFGEKCLDTDVADLVDFLASEKARFITGQVYVIDGGRSLSLKGSD